MEAALLDRQGNNRAIFNVGVEREMRLHCLLIIGGKGKIATGLFRVSV